MKPGCDLVFMDVHDCTWDKSTRSLAFTCPTWLLVLGLHRRPAIVRMYDRATALNEAALTGWDVHVRARKER